MVGKISFLSLHWKCTSFLSKY